MPTFEDVLKEERQQLWDQDHVVVEPEGVGLAFSGGGIRSATFNLGILQGLAQAKLLKKINYLSTVSGGGYIGGWLISWIQRNEKGVDGVQNELGDFPKFRPENETDVEPKQVNFLRAYSNYMTPRLGVFGADTWAAIATYLRNVILNQLILIGLLGAMVVLPWCLLTTSHSVSHRGGKLHYIAQHCQGIHSRQQGAWIVAGFAFLLLLVAVCWASWQGTRSSFTAESAPANAGQNYVLGLVILPLFFSAVLTMIVLWLAPTCNLGQRSLWEWALIGAGVYGVAHGLGIGCRALAIRAVKPDSRPMLVRGILIVVTAIAAGAVGGLLLELLNKLLDYWKVCGHGFAHALTWGPALFVAAFLLIGGLHIGLLKVLIQNEEQEWWGRAGGLLLLISIAWTGLFALTIFVPWLFATQGEWIKTKAIALLGWVAMTAFGVISGKSSKTSGKGDGNPALEAVASVAPYVFVAGLMILLSSGAFWLTVHKEEHKTACGVCETSMAARPDEKNLAMSLHIAHSTADGSTLTVAGKVLMEPGESAGPPRQSPAQLEEKFWEDISQLRVSRVWGVFFGLLIVTFLVAFRVDINIFSMNLLYRNRLVRCYLGASRRDCTGRDDRCHGRRPNPFTGFDPDDDLALALFRRRPTGTEVDKKQETGSAQNVWTAVGQNPYTGPYPIVCAALNVTHGERLAWQERKAESFVFTPLFCGYEFAEVHPRSDGEKPDGYQRTEEYAYPKDENDPSHSEIGGVHLGTAISISGAAASPNMGYHTSPPLAFLMTMFNVRLGWWLANSRYATKDVSWFKPKGAPRNSLRYLLEELFASTNDLSKFVYLSDGGHFENLAVYELVRRRCKYIIACDADADEGTNFGDLGNTIRKCRSDFGVEITLDTTKLRPVHKTKFAQAHGVVGTIDYPPGAGTDPKKPDQGYILYIKPTITKGVPRDVLAYRDSHPAFPDQTTLDQWFDESQFESYRKLGQHSFQTLSAESKLATAPVDMQTLFAGISA